MLKKRMQKFGWTVTKLTENIGAVLMFGLIVVNFLQVFFRYAIDKPLGWTEEVMRYALVWLVFLVSSAVLWRGEHMTIDILGEFLPEHLKKWLHLFNHIGVAAFCIILVWWGAPMAMRSASEVSPSAGIPMVIPMSAVAVGGLLMLIKSIILLTTTQGPEPGSKRNGGQQ